MAVGDAWVAVHGNGTTGDIRPSSGVEVMITLYVGSVYNSTNFTYVSAQPDAGFSSYVIVGAVYYSSSDLRNSWQYKSTYTGNPHGSTFYCKIPMTNSFYLYSGQAGTGFGNNFAGYILKD